MEAANSDKSWNGSETDSIEQFYLDESNHGRGANTTIARELTKALRADKPAKEVEEHETGRVLERFNMQSAKSASTPLPIQLRLSQRDCPISSSEGEDMMSVPYAPAIGSLMYAMVATGPDISHAVGVISRFMHNPDRLHWNAVKHVFRYLASTKDHGILFGSNPTSGVVGYTDSDFVSCVDSKK